MPRSRQGCTNCKRRHKKCDETRPQCINCQSQGLACDGYNFKLRWDVGTTARRHLTIASSPIGKPVMDSPPQPPSIASSGESPSGSYHAWDASDQNRAPATSSPAAPVYSPGQQQQEKQQQHRQEHELVDEFFQENVFELYSTHRNDNFPSMLRHLADGSEALTATLAGMQLYFEDPLDKGQRFEAYRTRGLNLFSRQLETYNGSLDAAVLCSGLFICTISLYQGIPWTPLLDHMVEVYELRRHFAQSMSEVLEPAARFVVEAMAIMDLPTFVRGRKAATLGIWMEMRTMQKAKGAQALLGGCETMTGLPRSLIDIFATIHMDDTADSRFLSWPGEVGDPPAIHLWDAYRYAGILTARRTRGQHRHGSAGGINPDTIMSRLIAALDALTETRDRVEYRGALASAAIMYPLVTARLEVSILHRYPGWLLKLKQIQETCRPYAGTANARHVTAILDEAFDRNDDECDLDAEARRRGVEIALF